MSCVVPRMFRQLAQALRATALVTLVAVGASAAVTDVVSITADTPTAYEPTMQAGVLRTAKPGYITIRRTGAVDATRIFFQVRNLIQPDDRPVKGQGLMRNAVSGDNIAVNRADYDLEIVNDSVITDANLTLPKGVTTDGYLGGAGSDPAVQLGYVDMPAGVSSVRLRVLPLEHPALIEPKYGRQAIVQLTKTTQDPTKDVPYGTAATRTASVFIFDSKVSAKISAEVATSKEIFQPGSGQAVKIDPGIIRVTWPDKYAVYRNRYLEVVLDQTSKKNGHNPAKIGVDYNLYYKIGGGRFGDGSEENNHWKLWVHQPYQFRSRDEESTATGQFVDPLESTDTVNSPSGRYVAAPRGTSGVTTLYLSGNSGAKNDADTIQTGYGRNYSDLVPGAVSCSWRKVDVSVSSNLPFEVHFISWITLDPSGEQIVHNESVVLRNGLKLGYGNISMGGSTPQYSLTVPAGVLTQDIPYNPQPDVTVSWTAKDGKPGGPTLLNLNENVIYPSGSKTIGVKWEGNGGDGGSVTRYPNLFLGDVIRIGKDETYYVVSGPIYRTFFEELGNPIEGKSDFSATRAAVATALFPGQYNSQSGNPPVDNIPTSANISQPRKFGFNPFTGQYEQNAEVNARYDFRHGYIRLLATNPDGSFIVGKHADGKEYLEGLPKGHPILRRGGNERYDFDEPEITTRFQLVASDFQNGKKTIAIPAIPYTQFTAPGSSPDDPYNALYSDDHTGEDLQFGQSVEFVVIPIDNALADGGREVTLSIVESNANNGYEVNGVNSATVTIEDNDTTVEVAKTGNAVEPFVEKGAGTNGTFLITCSPAPTTPRVIFYSLTHEGVSSTASWLSQGVDSDGKPINADIQISGFDPVANRGSVTVAAGSTTAVVSVKALEDGLEESRESFALQIVADANYIVGLNAVSYMDVDSPTGVITVGSPNPLTIYTPDSASAGGIVDKTYSIIPLTLTRRPGQLSSLTAAFTLPYTDGDATQTINYEAYAVPAAGSAPTLAEVRAAFVTNTGSPASVVFPAAASATALSTKAFVAIVAQSSNSDTALPIHVQVEAANTHQVNGTVQTVSLVANTLGQSSAAAQTVAEGSSKAIVISYPAAHSSVRGLTVGLTAGSGYHLLDAGSGTEYSDGATFNFPAGATSATFSFVADLDATVEVDQLVTVSFLDNGVRASTVMTITDNAVTMGAAAATITPGNSKVVAISLTGAVDQAVTVSYSVGGTATGAHYSLSPTPTVTIPAGSKSANLTVQTNALSTETSAKTVTITLTDALAGGTHLALGTAKTFTGTIDYKATISGGGDEDKGGDNPNKTVVETTGGGGCGAGGGIAVLLGAGALALVRRRRRN